MSIFRLTGLACLLALMATPLAAATVTVHVADPQGRAVGDAVITLIPESAVASQTPAQAPKTYYVDQKNEAFIPYVQILRPGDKVIFRNSDTTRHQVYSFSPIRQFEFVLRPGQSSPTLVLDKTGIVAVGCNIHDDMITYLFVSNAPAIGMSDRAGDATFDGLAPGRYTVRLWHPQLPPGAPQPEQQVSLGSAADAPHLKFTLTLVADPRGPMTHARADY
ncbi:methylamine utilization protein [Rhodanobacter sp. AS-Z3]|uniref:methylamine utilization protein n=1 Tax=Rhodanobacter sp. AS-Z3 TaxID=3031330 RepID=UPI0024794101|nr:methylamine utilization protein [Rhodanobacter sp. AS-Z3]WEN13828.1 methylamine utilization protein [Rhodanobacter sp. AS-Z3]